MSARNAQNVATLIATDTLAAGLVTDAQGMLAKAGLGHAGLDWIEMDRVVDIYFDGEVGIAKTALAPLTETIDIAVQPVKYRRKMLLISDMDSTMITIECIDELADYAGIKAEIAAVTERAMQGELDFVEALRSRVKLLAGLDYDVIQKCLDERATIMPGAQTLVRTMAGWGAQTILISGGFTDFAQPIAAKIGFAEYYANELEFRNNALTGEVTGAIVDAAAKQERLKLSAEQLGLSLSETLAAGDGANDIPMIEAAGFGVAYHAKPKAAIAADFAVRHGDLTALLYAQGIKRDKWAVV